MTYKVVLVDLPSKSKAFSIKNEDDSYTVVLNARLNSEQQRKSFHHEVDHILHNDFVAENVDDVEYRSHR